MEGGAEAPDPTTFVINWKQPYYMADAIGLRAFWPMPAHLLEEDFNTLILGQKDAAAFLAKPYWTTAYIHVGPFKLVQFTPGEDVIFDAVPDYFLGRPKGGWGSNPSISSMGIRWSTGR